MDRPGVERRLDGWCPNIGQIMPSLIITTLNSMCQMHDKELATPRTISRPPRYYRMQDMEKSKA
jgi:hypothetical protein